MAHVSFCQVEATGISRTPVHTPEALSIRARLFWTLGNLLLLGVVLLLYVGGVNAEADYSRYAASGDTAPLASSWAAR